MAQRVKRTVWTLISIWFERRTRANYLICVVDVQKPTPGSVHILVALVDPTHSQSCEHVDVVTGEIQGDEALENQSKTRPRGG